eukprot:GILI01033837.1.p1 GENE.GILI01033837.1~~GILI01033837.1.p1  ORF type:complete len:167 (+),score=23.91 GILI01033837.1:57-557(+)
MSSESPFVDCDLAPQTLPNGLLLRVARWSDLDDKALCMHVRTTVFVEEQNVDPLEEMDEHDPQCIHFVIEDTSITGPSRCVATARLLPDGHIGRVAVSLSHRKKGLGEAIMKYAVEAARVKKFSEVVLNGQVQAIPFYEKVGFEAFGDVFFEGPQIPHRSMRMRLV